MDTDIIGVILRPTETFASFHSEGKMLVSIDVLNILFKDFAIIGVSSWISLHEILSRPVALEADIFVKIENTDFSSVGFGPGVLDRR